MITVATWNVNSIRMRLPLFQSWMEKTDPDIILLQELKCQEATFPHELRHRYNVALWGQKTFNGVAILSKYPLEDIHQGVLEGDEQARYIEAVVSTPEGAIRCASVYVPNGQEVDSPQYLYKLQFMKALEERLKILHGYEEKVIIGGDYNIVPSDQDKYAQWESLLFCSPPERLSFQALLNIGYTDAGEDVGFTWWDYRQKAFEKNQGLRIDHMLLSPEAIDALETITVDRWVRECDKTSDHAPVRLSLSSS